jgi:hypothetical protein
VRASLLALLAITGCADAMIGPDDATDDPHDPAETAGDGLLAGWDGKADGLAAPGKTLAFTLASGAFPGSGHPDVVVYLPQRLDPTPPVDVIVFLHGWYNCASNVVGAVDTTCTPGAGTRRSYALAAQLEAARKNAILIVPELAYDQPSGNPGQLANDGALHALVDETLGKLEPELGPLGAGDVGRLVVASHSGGYQTAAAFATVGGMNLDELYLLDSLYGRFDAYDGWVEAAHDPLAELPPVQRFATVYTRDGGTRVNSQAMATRAAGWFASTPHAIVDDRTTSTWSAATYAHGLLFKRTGLSHDGVPRYYFGRLVATSGLADVR